MRGYDGATNASAYVIIAGQSIAMNSRYSVGRHGTNSRSSTSFP